MALVWQHFPSGIFLKNRKIGERVHVAFLKHLVFGGQNTEAHLYFGEWGMETHFFPQKSAEAVQTKVKTRRTKNERTDFIAIQVGGWPDKVWKLLLKVMGLRSRVMLWMFESEGQQIAPSFPLYTSHDRTLELCTSPFVASDWSHSQRTSWSVVKPCKLSSSRVAPFKSFTVNLARRACGNPRLSPTKTQIALTLLHCSSSRRMNHKARYNSSTCFSCSFDEIFQEERWLFWLSQGAWGGLPWKLEEMNVHYEKEECIAGICTLISLLATAKSCTGNETQALVMIIFKTNPFRENAGRISLSYRNVVQRDLQHNPGA